MVAQCAHHGARPHSYTLTQQPRSHQHLENLYFHLISLVQQTCAVQCLLRDPLGTTQTEGVGQDQLLPIPSALVTAPFAPVPRNPSWGQSRAVPSPAAPDPIFLWLCSWLRSQ